MPAGGGGGAPVAGVAIGVAAGAEAGADEGAGAVAEVATTDGLPTLTAGTLVIWGIGAAATGTACGWIPASPLRPAKPPREPTLVVDSASASGATTCNCGNVDKTSPTWVVSSAMSAGMSACTCSIAKDGFCGNSSTSRHKVCGTSRNRLIHQLNCVGSPASLSTMSWSPLLPPLELSAACRICGAGAVCGAEATAVVETA